MEKGVFTPYKSDAGAEMVLVHYITKEHQYHIRLFWDVDEYVEFRTDVLWVDMRIVKIVGIAEDILDGHGNVIPIE